MSHPNLKAQRENVQQTLEGLKMDAHLIENMINVGNKIDRIPPGELDKFRNDEHLVLVSCRNNTGLPVLVDKLDKRVQKITGSKLRRFRLKPGSPLAAYLYAEGFVAEEPSTDNEGNLIFCVQMTDTQLERFQAHLKGSGRKIKRLATA